MRLLTQPIRLPRFKAYVPAPTDPAIFWFNSEREDIVREVTTRLVDRFASDPKRLEYVLNEAAYHEVRRLEAQRDDEARRSLGFWRSLVRRLGRMEEEDKRERLREVVERMSWDVAGNFDPRVYDFAQHVVPRVLTGVMSPASLPRDLIDPTTSRVDELLTTEGEIPLLRRLAKQGTLVFVPTHSSNLDSIVLGYALQRNDLPPVVYGAGKNLFTNPIISFFMHNLGAYRVDRRIRAPIYKDVLKTYSCVMIERGYHSLFFPGGTRSRAGMVERHLKLGLAGSVVDAFARNRVRGVQRPIWFVPTTINYALVLEAETLIGDHLAEQGKARYIIEDDEFSRVDRWVAFFRQLVGLSSPCVIRFGRPIDPFGNDVDEEGRSLTPLGAAIDPGTYVSRRGEPVLDAKRDEAYTRELGELLVERFERETVIMATQMVSHVLFRRIVRSTPGLDLFARVRMRGEVSIGRKDLVREVGEARDALVELEQKGETRVSSLMRRATPDQLIDRTLSAFSGYHGHKAAVVEGGDVVAEDPPLLLYYQNRLVHLAERIADGTNDAAAREIAAMGRPA